MVEERKNFERKNSDFLIRPNLDDIDSYTFKNIPQIIDRGKTTAISIIDSLKKQLEIKENNYSGEKYKVGAISGSGAEFLDISVGDSIGQMEIIRKLNDIYRTAEYELPHVEMIIYRDSISLNVEIDHQPNFKGIIFEDSVSFDRSILANLIPQGNNNIANLDSLDIGLARIEDYYRNQDYTLAHIESATFSGGRLRVCIEEGIIYEIDIRGNKRTKDWVVKSFVPLNAGDIFTDRSLNEALSNLHATGLFSNVFPEIRRTSQGVVLVINVIEKPYIGMRAGLRYDLINNIEGALEIGDENILGLNWRGMIGGYIGERRWNAYTRLESDRVWRSYIHARADAYGRSYLYDIWEGDSLVRSDWINRYGLSVSLGQQIKRLGTVFLEMNTEKVAIDRNNSIVYDKSMHKLTLRSIVDTFDDRQFPRRGKYHHGYITFSKDILGGEFSFNKFYTSLQSYWTWIDNLTVHPYIAAGYCSGEPPSYERFELGNDEDFWGYRQGQNRGNSVFEGSIDIRLNVLDPVYIVTGTSFGRTWRKKDKLHLEDIVWGWGAKLGVSTIIGPVQFGWGMNTEKFEEISLSIGYDFE